MPVGCPSLSRVLGFFTVVQRAEVGWFGGYLVLNGVGRPLEFHCTAPVRPSKAQHILYGPTLGAFLLGEQIGPALLAKSKVAADLIVTDQRDGLALAERTEAPVLLVSDGAADDQQDDDETAQGADGRRPIRRDGPHAGPAGRRASGRWTLGGRVAELAPVQQHRAADVRALYETLPHELDLLEPFARIVEAIGEAQRAVR